MKIGKYISRLSSLIGVFHLRALPPGGPPGFSSSEPFMSIWHGISPWWYFSVNLVDWNTVCESNTPVGFGLPLYIGRVKCLAAPCGRKGPTPGHIGTWPVALIMGLLAEPPLTLPPFFIDPPPYAEAGLLSFPALPLKAAYGLFASNCFYCISARFATGGYLGWKFTGFGIFGFSFRGCSPGP